MQGKRYQTGMSIWSLSFVVGVFGFMLFLVFKLFPPYMEDFKIRNALESVARANDMGAMSKDEIAQALARRFSIDNIDGVDPAKNLFIEPRGRNSRLVRLSYEAVIPLFYNVSVLLEFDHRREVRGAE